MPSSRVVAVLGATGLQGSAVVERLLNDGTFIPRAITRDPESEASRKLKARGVEVVKGDSGDKASLVNALRGTEAVFAMTLPSPLTLVEMPSEETQGRNIVAAAKEVGVKFFVFSSLPSLKRISGGKYSNVAHYDGAISGGRPLTPCSPLNTDKEEIEQYLKASDLAYASLHLGGFTSNLWRRNTLKKTPTGFNISIPKYSPTALQAFTWVENNVPEATITLLKNYDDPSRDISGKVYPVVTATMSYPDLAGMIAKTLKAEVTFTTLESSGIPVLDEMFAAQSEYNGLYTSTPVPNPDLAALGAQFGTMEEFMETQVKHRFC
ncbi:hypothetical protein B0H16DRAFT_1424930 [Mycena metata]|uniref:NmrA-like domain-containing protein n=1 Tax=Mycena metata TaxID=1033252 RepID=A0AAD7I9Z1_9AGAR|nr:hypothetical protein B0H16DRAFT_1424930 [Mycena metata]